MKAPLIVLRFVTVDPVLSGSAHRNHAALRKLRNVASNSSAIQRGMKRMESSAHRGRLRPCLVAESKASGLRLCRRDAAMRLVKLSFQDSPAGHSERQQAMQGSHQRAPHFFPSLLRRRCNYILLKNRNIRAKKAPKGDTVKYFSTHCLTSLGFHIDQPDYLGMITKVSLNFFFISALAASRRFSHCVPASRQSSDTSFGEPVDSITGSVNSDRNPVV